jgi:hypothetical protein
MNEMKRLRMAKMTTEEKHNSIMAGFLKDNYPFEKGYYYEPVALHQAFANYIESHPLDRIVKYRVLFPNGAQEDEKVTKIIFRDFLDKTLQLPRNTRDRSYWIKNENIAKEINERLDKLIYQGRLGKLIVHTKLKP